MNIFYLDHSPIKSAKWQCDKHVVKMILESAQMLCTAHRVIDESDDEILYKKTHVNHPSSIWVRESVSNYQWLYAHFKALCEEYTERYGKAHKTETKLLERLSVAPMGIPEGDLTTIRLAMPEEFKSSCEIASYRAYYQAKSKEMKMTWKQNFPEFMKKVIENV